MGPAHSVAKVSAGNESDAESTGGGETIARVFREQSTATTTESPQEESSSTLRGEGPNIECQVSCAASMIPAPT